MNTKIKPSDINSSAKFLSLYGRRETEQSAEKLVLFAQKRDQGWDSFTVGDVVEFLELQERGFSFYGLLDIGAILEEEGAFHFTDKFVEACYANSPAK